MSDPLDLGHGHILLPIMDGIGAIAGYTIDHQRADNGANCSGTVTLDTAPAGWRGSHETWHQDSANPLTLSPSVLCTQCGDHGFVRDGKWIPA